MFYHALLCTSLFSILFSFFIAGCIDEGQAQGSTPTPAHSQVNENANDGRQLWIANAFLFGGGVHRGLIDNITTHRMYVTRLETAQQIDQLIKERLDRFDVLAERGHGQRWERNLFESKMHLLKETDFSRFQIIEIRVDAMNVGHSLMADKVYLRNGEILVSVRHTVNKLSPAEGESNYVYLRTPVNPAPIRIDYSRVEYCLGNCPTE